MYTSSMSNELTTTNLTAKNKAFIASLLKGKKVLEAYHEAGYKGDEAAAYTLKHRLKAELAHFINAKTSLDDTMLELDQLDELELTQRFLTMNQKIRIISLKLQALKQKHIVEQTNSPTKSFTAFVINRTGDKAVISTHKVIDAEVVKTDTSDSPTEQA